MRILALDLGDVWNGVAISDPLGITARPYATIPSTDLFIRLKEIISKEKINHIIVGYPQTLRGTHSAQTEKILLTKKAIEEQFSDIKCTLIDERFTSQRAAVLKKARDKSDKLEQHAIAAALILTSYLEHQHFLNEDL
jgi:putative Holliday junction resolvase